MATRDELYQKFGPMMTEALARLTLQQINVLRVKAGLAAITAQQFLDALDTELANLEQYEWMTNGDA